MSIATVSSFYCLILQRILLYQPVLLVLLRLLSVLPCYTPMLLEIRVGFGILISPPKLGYVFLQTHILNYSYLSVNLIYLLT
jgi:hypothetical protein